jgi:queuine tRNA-ribosyltransferase
MTNQKPEFKFEIIKEDPKSKARAGILHTPHGPLETPVFMTVGTQATVKSVTPQQLHEMDVPILLANTYHLALRPGPDLIEKHGGLHKFMNWDKPILTDSGGYQVFSLSNQRKITPDGVTFKSHIDGSKHVFTPKSVIDIQRKLNSDIMMPLDICTEYPATKKKVAEDLKITHAWEKEAVEYWRHTNTPQWLFAIVQGGMYKDLRAESAETLSKMDFPGYAIGGLSVGEPRELLEEYIAYTAPLLPDEKPKYVMGLGLPENLDFAIQQGVDMFDCVIPTRLARHGQVFMKNERINIKKQCYKDDLTPIDSDCTCYTCQHFSKAYLRHLFIAKEILASTLMSIHNIHSLVNQVRSIRNRILES